uniref:Glycine N-acyltransferase-like protein n=1 Tax=Lepisosteus oculatus TaxID=7918 RepID=W5LVC0_LEPOC
LQNEQCENTLYLLHDDVLCIIQVYGGLLHIMNSNRCSLEFCVDSWPNFNTVICRRQNKVLTSHPVQFPNLCTMFTKDLENLRAMLMDDRVIDWTQDTIKGIPGSYCDLIKEVSTGSGMDVKEFKGYNLMVHHNPESLLHNEKMQRHSVQSEMSDPTLKISSLKVSHAELVAKQFDFGGSDLILNHVRSCIQHLPSACILDDSGNPVSWCFSDELCEMRMAFTLPEYRRTGHMKTALTALIKQIHAMGFPVYAHVSEENTTAINMLTSFGFSFSPCIWSITCMPYL